MSDLLKAASQVDVGTVDTITTTPRSVENPYTSKLALSMNPEATLLERMAQLESTVKDGFEKISGILSNSPVLRRRMSGGRRKTRRSKRARSK